MEKDIKNTYAITYKLRSASTKTTNHIFKVTRKKKLKREEIVERRKTKAIAAKRQRTKGEISLSSEKKANYKSNTRDIID